MPIHVYCWDVLIIFSFSFQLPGLPRVAVKGCVFHWTQAVWRRVQDLGLKPAYSQRNSIYNYIRQLLALPFLPQNHIPPTFQQLYERANTDQLQRLVAYIDRQRMNHAIFDVPSWCIFGCTVRTNNDVEGKHKIILCFINCYPLNQFPSIVKVFYMNMFNKGINVLHV